MCRRSNHRDEFSRQRNGTRLASRSVPERVMVVQDVVAFISFGLLQCEPVWPEQRV